MFDIVIGPSSSSDIEESPSDASAPVGMILLGFSSCFDLTGCSSSASESKSKPCTGLSRYSSLEDRDLVARSQVAPTCHRLPRIRLYHSQSHPSRGMKTCLNEDLCQ